VTATTGERALPYTITRTRLGYVAQHTAIKSIRFVGRNAVDLGRARVRVINHMANELMEIINAAPPLGYPPPDT
jgi:hypothetical protein